MRAGRQDPGDPPSTALERLAFRVYSACVRLTYPAGFRARFGDEMIAWFLRELRATRRTGSGVTTYLAWALVDALRTGTAIRWRRVRRVRTFTESIRQDIRGSLRTVRRHPLLVGALVLTLALPMAVNTAVLGVVDAALLRPLPYPDPETLVAVWVQQPGAGTERARLAGPELSFFWDEARSFDAVGGIWSRYGTLGGVPGPEHVDIGYVTAGFFQALGVAPQLGRVVGAQDDVEGAGRTILLSHHLWVSRYGADPAVVGRRVDFNGAPVTVIGVLPRDFLVALPREARLASGIDAYLPWGGGYADMPIAWRLFATVGRLAPGATVEQAQEEMAGLAPELLRRYPDYGDAGLRISADPLHAEVTAPLRPGLLTLMASAVILLLMAGTNASALLLARTLRRDTEFAIRTALGAGRGRLVRQITVEHVVLFLLAGGAGMILAPTALRWFRGLVPEGMRFIHEPALDLRILSVTFVAVLGLGILFGILPALGLGRRPGSIRAGRLSEGRRARALRGGLLSLEVALSIVLLVGSGLLLRSFIVLRATDPGFRAEGVLTARLSLPSARFSYAEPQRISGFYEELLRRLEGSPAITHAALTEQLPLVAGSNDAEPYAWEGPEGETSWGETVAHTRPVSRRYFETVGAELLEGRWFDERDDLDGELAVIVDDRLATRAWPGRSAVGSRIKIPLFLHEETVPAWARIVGVVRHVQLTPLAERGPAQVWLHHLQSPRRSSSLVVRGRADAESLAAVVRRTVTDLDPDRPVFEVEPMSAFVERSLAPTRFLMGLTGAFALLTLCLAAVGLYALLSQAIAGSRREIGIRLALGAPRRHVAGGLLRWILGHVGLGTLAGGLVALLIAGALESLLVGISPRDPATVLGAVGLTGVMALSGTVGPLLQAVRTDPARVLDDS